MKINILGRYVYNNIIIISTASGHLSEIRGGATCIADSSRLENILETNENNYTFVKSNKDLLRL